MYMYIYIYIYIVVKYKLYPSGVVSLRGTQNQSFTFLKWKIPGVFWMSGLVFWVPKWAKEPGPIGGLLKSSLNLLKKSI